jgi:TolB protein
MTRTALPGKLSTFFRIVLLCALLAALIPGSPALAWGSLRDGVLDYNTHGNIDVVAWRLLNNEVDLRGIPAFPTQAAVFGQDFVSIDWFGNQLASSTGPDYEPSGGPGPITSFAWHYGGAPAATQSLYTSLIASLYSGTGDPAHNAAWLAHFVADQYVPYHTLGVAYTGQSAAALDDPGFSDDPQDFINAATAATNGNMNWYDPSYWDSSISTQNSTHIYWERQVAHPTRASVPPGFDSHWDNAQPLASRMSAYVQQIKTWTNATFNLNTQTAVHDAVRGVYTAWRASITALGLEANVTSSDNGSQAFVVVATVKNLDRIYEASNVRVKIALPAGLALEDPSKETQFVGTDGRIVPNGYAKAEWLVTSSGGAQACADIIVALAGGEYPQGVPDLVSALPSTAPEIFKGVEAKVAAPPVVTISAPASGSKTNETKVEVSGQISEANTQSWIEVNNSDKIWISEGFNGGTSFSKEVELKSGDNVITVKAVNSCGKQGKATIHVTGEFTESAVKVVMSWNTNGTDVDLHLTSSNAGDSECYYNNKNPNWGDPNSTLDDPVLDIDNTSGYGPETIIVPQPKPGQYTVRVVYYSDHDSENAIPSFVTVKTYENGVYKGTYNRTLSDTGDTWESIYTFNIPASQAQPVSAPTIASGASPQKVETFNGSEIALTTDGAYQYAPAIDGNQVVWVDEREGNHSQIYRYDLNTHSQQRVSRVDLSGQSGKPMASVILQQGPAVDGSNVVWSDNRFDAVHLYKADLLTGNEITLTASLSETDSRHAIDGDKVVWSDRRNGNADIYLYNLTSGVETRLTSDTADQLLPDISGDRVVWADTRLGGYTIYMYDLSTQTESQISRASTGGLYPPAIDGDLIVWTDGRNGNNDIFLYNLATREESELTSNLAEQDSPAISGNQVVWVDYRSSNPDIYSYDLNRHIEMAVTTNNAAQNEPAISAGRVVWTDYRDGNANIYMANLAGAAASSGVYLPLVIKNPQASTSGGINGKVTYQGAAAANLALDLRWWDGASWSTRSSATTQADGSYHFNNAPSLSAGQSYYVRFLNSPSAPNPGTGYLYAWYGSQIDGYTSGSSASGGDFDVKDISLTSPASGASVNLPAAFCWEARGVAGDNYRLAFYNPETDTTGYTSFLGSDTCTTITGLPQGWNSGVQYEWWVNVYQGSNPDANANNYGTSYYYHLATINFSPGQMSLAETDWQMSKSGAEVNRR